jgi:hypothetical protein
VSISWKYPIYLIPLEGGYLSVVDTELPEPHPHHLAVFTAEDRAEEFSSQCHIMAQPRALRNTREFGWLLQSLREPVTRVAFDPRADSPSLACRWNVGVDELLRDHLRPDNSPWNYPIFVISQEQGIASIDGQTPTGQSWRALGVFTSRERAEAYIEACKTPGTVLELPDLAQTRERFISLSAEANAVAIDPIIDQGRHTAAHCFTLQTLLEKYLTRSTRPERSHPDPD